MAQDLLGVATYHTRVESWECDHNGHWNVRNYMGVFQKARDVAATLSGAEDAVPLGRLLHMRFHHELFEMAPVELRSARLADGDFKGATVHLLYSGDVLSATALEPHGTPNPDLPEVASDAVKRAFPRGLDPKEIGIAPGAKATPERQFQHGFVQPHELDHSGTLSAEFTMARCATASQHILHGLGFSNDYTKETGISRMSMVAKLIRHAPCGVGTQLIGRARYEMRSSKAFRLVYDMEDLEGRAIATVEQLLLTVNLNTRRIVDAPAFLREATGG